MTEPLDSLALAYVSVGSNIEPEKHIEAAIDLLMTQVRVTAVSTFYRTEPIGRPDQPQYLNGVFEIRTSLPAEQVTPSILYPIEQQLGRVRTLDKFASRTLDLDLVLYNDLESRTQSLMLPHPDIDRIFVRGPIRELLSRPALMNPYQSAMLNLLPAYNTSFVIGKPLETLTRRLRAKLR